MTANGESLTMAAAMHGLVGWSANIPLPDWQRDALRRLYSVCPLPVQDEADLFALCKQLHGLNEANITITDSVPLANNHVPALDAAASSVTIASLANAERVNALAERQILRFDEQGLTVVFGNNGSGKSGYGRILKTICRARGTEEILHNVYVGDAASPASAEVTYSIGGQRQPVLSWKNGSANPDMLSHVSVFDSKCAPFHVDEKNEAAYTPLPLQILKELSDISRRFKTSLQQMATALENQRPASIRETKCSPSTEAGLFLASLNSESDMQLAERLASVTEIELKRLQALKQQLQTDPKQLIAAEESTNRRLQDLLLRVNALFATLGEKESAYFRSLLEDAKAKSEAARIAATVAFRDEPLSGVGTDTWNALWSAARQFSELEAYKDVQFPSGKDSVCVLCQQPLNDDAKDRFSRFENFVKENAQLAADEALNKVKVARAKIREGRIEPSNYSQDIYFLKVDCNNDELATKLTRFFRICAVRRGRLIAAAMEKPWIDLVAINHSAIDAINSKMHESGERLEFLKSSFEPEARELLLKELQELTDRLYLQEVLPDVRVEIARQKRQFQISCAIADTDTSKITRKSTELADALVTDAWRDRFASEVSRLGIHHLRIELQRDGGAYGAAKFRVTLIRDSSVKLGKVLSEGEYRCIALAAFFSELATSDSKSTLVFDDPVSSLDHDHREVVSKRLAEEAASGRQIIVFTHDVFFLELLSRHSLQCNASVKYRTVSRVPDNSRSGVIENGVPSNVAPADVLADGIRAQVRQFEQAYHNGHQVIWHAQTNSFSNQLRKCWERAVAQVVSPVLERFNTQIDTKNIWQLAALELNDCVEMRTAYKRCSELNHEKCAEFGRAAPSPSDYYQEIDTLTSWIQIVRARQETAQNQRPQL